MGMVRGVFKAKSILQEFKPDAVIGVGGYASFPMLSAATLGATLAMLVGGLASHHAVAAFCGRRAGPQRVRLKRSPC